MRSSRGRAAWLDGAGRSRAGGRLPLRVNCKARDNQSSAAPMLLSGVESLLDSSVCAVIEELCTGLPKSISTELMAVSEPNVGLDAKSGVSMPVLGHSDSLSAEHHRTSAAENFCQKTEDLGDLLKVISHGPGESFTEALLKAGDLEKDETNKKRNFRKLDCCSDGYQKEDKEAQVAEDYHAECCALTPGESGSEQENPHLQQHEVKSWTMCGTGTVGSPKSTGEKQASIQVTAETLTKLTEEVQGMKADGTSIVSKAGCRKDSVSKGLPPKSTECPEAGAVTARAGLSETSTLGFLEPLKGTDIESAPEHPQEMSDSRGLRAHAAMPLSTGGDVVPGLETREEKLRGQNPGNEFSAPLANCQTYQQDEESSASSEPLRLSSIESCRTHSTESSEIFCSVLKSFCYPDCRNMPLEKQSIAVHGTVTETLKKDLPKPIKNQALYDHGIGPVENQTSTSKSVEQTSVVRSKGLSSAKNDPVLSSAAAPLVELSKGKFKMVPSEGSKLKKEQWQFSASGLFRDDVKTSSLLMKTSSIACPGAEQTDICLDDAASEIPPPSSHSCLDFSTKPEKNSPEAQLVQKESKSNTTPGELADSPDEATGAISDASLSTGKEADLIYTLNVTLPPVAQKSREPHCKESLPCPASEFSSRDKAQGNVPGKDSVCASGATREQVPEVVFHNDQFQSSGSSRTFYNPTRTKKISQKNMKPSAGNPEPVVTAPENEQSAMGSCRKWSKREQCVAASASCLLSGSTCVGDAFLNSPYSHAEVDKNIEENGNLEGEASAGYHSKKAVTFPAAHCPWPLGSLPPEDAHSSGGTHLHGLKDTSTGKPRSCSAYTAEKPPATLVRGEVSNKSMEAVKLFDGSRVTGSSEIVCDNLGLCSSALGLKERELAMDEKEEVSVLPADHPECTAAIWGTCPALSLSVQTPHTSQMEQALCQVQNPCLAPGRDFGDPILGSKQHSESLNKPPTGLQTTATSVEGYKLSICSRQREEILLKTRDDLPPLGQKCATEDSLQGPMKYKAVELDSLKGVRTQDCLGCGGFGSHLTEEKTIKLKEQESRCEREGKGALEGNASGDKPRCSQQHPKEQAELLLAGDKPQPPLPKLKLEKEQGSTVSVPSLPCSSAQQSPLCKPENSQMLSVKENQNCLRIKPTLNNSCLQLTPEPGTESDAQQGIDPSHPQNCDSQESFPGAEVDSGSPPAVSWETSVAEKEKLCAIAEQTPTQNCSLASARGFNEDSSVAKPLSVAMSVKRKGSTAEMPSAGSDRAVGFLNGAKSSRVCAHSKASLRKEGRGVLAAKDRDVTSQKRTRHGQKIKSTYVEEKMGREVAPRRKLPVDSFPTGEYCLGVLLEDSKESGSKIVPLTENCGKVLDKIPRSNLNNLSKERNKNTQLPGLAGASLLSEAMPGAHTEDAPDAETASGLQCEPAPTLPPQVTMRRGSCKEPPPSCVGGSEVCVPYTLHAQSKGHLKGRARGQDTKPIHSACKERKALGSKRLDRAEQCQVLQRKKQRGKVEAHLADKAQPEQRSGCPEKAKITLQPHVLHSSELLHSSLKELVTPRNGKLEGPSEEIFTVRTSKNKPCSTLQEVKRPKITTDVISSQIVKTQDSEMENLNLNLGYEGIPGAFSTTTKIRGPLPLKIQPGRTCKKVPTLCQLKTIRKHKQMKSSPFFEAPLEVLPKQDKTLLKSLCLPRRAAAMEVEAALSFVHVPGQRARRCSLLSSLKFRKCTKEPALLSRLSAMASKLLAPAKGTHGLEALPYPSEILPVAERCSQRRSKNLLEAFSCINRSLHSRWADSWCTKMFTFQPLALYPLESTKILFSDLSQKPPASSLDSLAFPMSFHIKLDSSPVPDLRGITSQHSVHHRPVQMAAPPSEWTFSFLLSQSCSDPTALEDGSSLDAELHSSRSVTTPGAPVLRPDQGRNAVAGRRGGYSMHGLHTVLALSSPGCYRIWTRRRNLTSHIPTIQRLFISQFAQGLKEARHPPSVADDLVSSLPYSLGRALSMWSQHGPSACPSEINPLHSNPCKWQPGVGIDNSYAMLPHLPVQSVEALQTAGHEIRLEASFPLLLPKPCSLPEPVPCPARLSASEVQVHALNDADESVPACLGSQDDTELKKTEPEERPKKVSQIRIRKTVPKPDPNLTPMGLPKPKRLKKKEFSLEEIYTNKNYKSPPPARSLETIFEEPKEKNGHFISVSQQKRKRILEFQDFTLPRKRRTRGKIKAMGSCTRAKSAALQSAELDALLSQKLMDLEAFFAKEAEQEQASGI